MRCNRCGNWFFTKEDYCQSCKKSILIQKYERALFLICYQLTKYIDNNDDRTEEEYWLTKVQQQNSQANNAGGRQYYDN